MTSSRLKNFSRLNLAAGYLLFICFFILILLNRQEAPANTEVVSATEGEALFIEKNSTKTEKEYIYAPSPPHIIYHDRLVHRDVNLVTGRDVTVSDRITDIDTGAGLGVDYEISKNIGDGRIHAVDAGAHGRVLDIHDGVGIGVTSSSTDSRVDVGLLDRRLSEQQNGVGVIDLDDYDKAIKEDRSKIGVAKEDDSLDFGGLTLARDGDDIELGDLDDLNTNFDQNKKGYGIGRDGELYAYNFPSRGVGAGIGSSAIGAGAGGGAGLSAGIGEGVLNGEAVPTLGGVGSGPLPLGGQSTPSPGSGGVGGLVGGAGAGGAAGLTQGYVTEKLGLGIREGKGGAGYGGGRGRNYDHLPRDGALHIMMHVDGSGSILNTRKQLEEMKETLLKDALLPYYNDSEGLYNKRVTIVDGSGERTLRFFTEASKKDNVLALVFQDEAQPAYHLPNFNKKPEDHYLDDLSQLKSNLNNHKGLYRGVMFQVDRGKTFAKSFKEFVEYAWQGGGYLKGDNLKKYYWEDNHGNIKNKEGIVFSDVYHAKDEGDPQYYLNLIFEASKKIGLDLNAQSAGLTDGKYNSD